METSSDADIGAHRLSQQIQQSLGLVGHILERIWSGT